MARPSPAGPPVVLVTGGSRGIGRAVVLELARHGTHVIVQYARRADAARRAVEEAERAGARALAVRADVRRTSDLARLMATVRRWSPRLDGLVTCAGIYRGSGISEAADDEWHEVLEVDLLGTARTIRSALPMLRARPGASIVSVSSILGAHAAVGGVAYQAAKAGVEQLTRALAVELAPAVRVNAVAPGFIRTDMNRGGHTDPAFSAFVADATPLGRWGEPEDVAPVVRWLLGPSSRWVTGAVLGVDGGQSLR